MAISDKLSKEIDRVLDKEDQKPLGPRTSAAIDRVVAELPPPVQGADAIAAPSDVDALRTILETPIPEEEEILLANMGGELPALNARIQAAQAQAEASGDDQSFAQRVATPVPQDRPEFREAPAGGVPDTSQVPPPLGRPAQQFSRAEDIGAVRDEFGRVRIVTDPGGEFRRVGGTRVQERAVTEAVERAPVSPETQQLLMDTAQELRDSIVDRAGAAGQNLASIADTLSALASDDIEALNQIRANREQRRRTFDKQARVLRDLSNEVANNRINPSNFFASRSSGAQFGASIAVALGALGQAMLGGPNQALDIINGAIDRDMEAQLANQQARERGLQREFTLFDRLLGQLDDEAEAELFYRNAALQMAENQIRGLVARGQSAEVVAQARVLLAEMEAQRAANIAEAEQNAMVRTSTISEARDRVVGGRLVRTAPETRAPNLQELRFLRENGVTQFGDMEIGTENFQSLPEPLQVATLEFERDSQNLIEAIDNLISLRDRYGAEVLDGEVLGERDANIAFALGGINTIANTGVLNEGEREFFLENVFGDQNQIDLRGRTLARLRGIRNALSTRRRRNAENPGGRLLSNEALRQDLNRQGIDFQSATEVDFE